MTTTDTFPFEVVQDELARQATKMYTPETISVPIKSTAQRLLGLFPGLERFVGGAAVEVPSRAFWTEMTLRDRETHLVPGRRYEFIIGSHRVTGTVVQRYDDQTARIAVDHYEYNADEIRFSYRLLSTYSFLNSNEKRNPAPSR